MGKSLVHRIRVEAHAVWLAVQDKRTPLPARVLGFVIAAYALSPIDLIPDGIPVLGLLDDALLIPAGVWLIERLISPAQFAEHRAEAERAAALPVSRMGMAIVLAVWAAVAWLAWTSAIFWFD